jgi:clan AA aspartic protease
VIRGIVTPEREATIPLTIRGPLGHRELQAVIDTGFDDLLTVPPELIAELGLPYAAPAQAMLADGNIVNLAYYEGTVDWDGAPRTVLALGTEGSPLVGMSLLYGYDLFIETIDGGGVSITRRP